MRAQDHVSAVCRSPDVVMVKKKKKPVLMTRQE